MMSLSDRRSEALSDDDQIVFFRRITSGIRYGILNLEKMHISIRSLIGIPKILRLLPNVWKIHLFDNMVTDSGLQSVLNMFKIHTNLNTLDIGCNDISDRSILALSELIRISTFRRIQLGRKEMVWQANRFSVDSISSLIDSIPEKNRIECFGLSGAVIIRAKKSSQRKILSVSISQLVSKCKNLSTLDVSYLGFTEGDQDNLGNGLSMSSHLRVLRLCGNSFAKRTSLVSGIVHVSSLKSLDLSSCLLQDNSIIILADALKKGWGLIYLNISENPIGSNGIGYLFKCLSENVHLYDLNVSHTGFNSEISTELSIFLEMNYTLGNLDMSRNNIGDSLVETMSRSFSQNISISYLNLSSCRISDQGAIPFMVALSSNKFLKRLILKDNFLSNDFGFDIVEILRSNETVFKIDCSSNKLDMFSTEAINKLCYRNKISIKDQRIAPLKKEYIQLSIKKSQVPSVAKLLEEEYHTLDSLRNDSVSLEVDIEEYRFKSNERISSAKRIINELEQIIGEEERTIQDLKQKEIEMIEESENRINEINQSTERDLLEKNKYDRNSEIVESECEKVVNNMHHEKELLNKEIEDLEAFIDSIKRMNENKNELISCKIPLLPNASTIFDALIIPEVSNNSKKSARRSGSTGGSSRRKSNK